ncbi:penicillin-binding protein 2 [Xanthomonadaceae bacterium XH05]|nr:penicillin-binding protein 2 [Xanthomonadaceae bacterium XH05]
MRNPLVEASVQRRRALIGFILVFMGLMVLAARFAYLQVVSYEEFHTRSEANRIKARPIVPARGLIYDRNGRLLADNIPAYRLDAVREDIGDLDEMVARLREVIELSDEDAAAFIAASRARRAFQPVTVKLRLSEAEVARFAVDRHRFPGVDVVPYLNRRYPYGDLFAHVIGYVGRIDSADLARVDAARYSGATHIGKAGVERTYEGRLHGQVGIEQVEVNAEGRVLRVVGREPAHAGQDLYLTIDADLQQSVVDAFDGQHGAAVVLDPRNGEVLAMVSLPSYDPNPFVSGIGRLAYASLLDNVSRPLFNRALQGGYEPGSTLKPFVAMAGLDTGLRTPRDTTFSSGAFRLPGHEREYRDWRRGGHGHVNLNEAMAQSVNTYFFQLAVDLGIERFSAYMARFGFGEPTGIDLQGEASGVLPTPQWKRIARNQPWFPGETVIAGIGQGFWVVTPLQLVQATAMLANGGMRVKPHLLRASQSGFDVPPVLESMPAPGAPVVDHPEHLTAVAESMVAVLHGPTGTARGVMAQFDLDYRIAGKTGTAQRITRRTDASLDVSALPFDQRHNALFIAFAPVEAPRVAVMVVVEHGGSGSSVAAPVALRIIDAWLRKNPA